MFKKIAIVLSVIILVAITTYIVLTKYTLYLDDQESLTQKGIDIAKKCDEGELDMEVCAKELDKLFLKSKELKQNGQQKK